MATTYKEINSTTPLVLEAPVYADGVQIHATHRLRSCIRWQWYRDPLNADGTPATPVAITGATNETLTVDLTAVANSGEYYAEITIGNTTQCDQISRRERVSIIQCLDQTDRTFSATGANGEFRVDAPHYESPVFNREGNEWINPGTIVPCDTQAANVCRFVQNFTLDDQVASSNSARRGQPTITIGEFVCFYNIVQDYVNAAPAAPAPDVPAGPFINLSSDGPVLAGSFFGDITVTADVGTIGGAGTETYTVAWENAVATANDRIATVANPDAVQPITVTATVTDNNGLTATESITVNFITLIPISTTVVGDTLGRVNWRVLETLGPGGSPPGIRSVTGRFTADGAGDWTASLNFYNGFFGTTNSGTATVTITGPGVNETLTVTSASPSTMFEATARVGVYNWTLNLTGVTPDNSYANAGLLLYARQF